MRKRTIRLTQENLKDIVEETVKRVLPLINHQPSKDDIFDLDSIPMDILDNGWQRYHPYLFTIDHRNPLANRVVEESTDYKKQILLVKEAIVKTFPIDETQFVIKEGSHGLYAAILVALTDDNVDIIEQAMEDKGFFRSQPTDEKLLLDRKNRTWIDVRFEPKEPDDVTQEVHRKYSILYHLTPSVFEDNVKKDGLKVSNNNPNYRYSESRVFLSEGDVTDEDIQQLVNTLYAQAQDRHINGLTPEYSLFAFDLSKMGNDFRFFYDINEPKGLYTKIPIPPTYIVQVKHISAESTDKIP
ncbi:MAG: hypothetical protein J6T04_02070 [Bacteroidales bacterium]|nr:hypothetical protein [Bacteroidales bacterium]